MSYGSGSTYSVYAASPSGPPPGPVGGGGPITSAPPNPVPPTTAPQATTIPVVTPGTPTRVDPGIGLAVGLIGLALVAGAPVTLTRRAG